MNYQNPKTSIVLKKRLNQEQVRLLEASFDASKKLEPERKLQLARDLGIPARQIAIWYQNKRARWKNQSLELDYGSIQVRLEAALAEKRELQREVDMLRVELKRAQDIMLGRAQQASLSSCSDEGAACSSLNDDSANWPNVEELYACLMAGAAKGPLCPSSDGVNKRDYWV